MPSLKEKKRYVIFEVVPIDKKLNGKPLYEVTNHIRESLGKFDSFEAGIMPIDYNSKANKGILRVNHKFVDKVKASLLFLSKIGNESVIVKSIGVSGLINKAKIQANSNN